MSSLQITDITAGEPPEHHPETEHRMIEQGSQWKRGGGTMVATGKRQAMDGSLVMQLRGQGTDFGPIDAGDQPYQPSGLLDRARHFAVHVGEAVGGAVGFGIGSFFEMPIIGEQIGQHWGGAFGGWVADQGIKIGVEARANAMQRIHDTTMKSRLRLEEAARRFGTGLDIRDQMQIFGNYINPGARPGAIKYAKDAHETKLLNAIPNSMNARLKDHSPREIALGGRIAVPKWRTYAQHFDKFGRPLYGGKQAHPHHKHTQRIVARHRKRHKKKRSRQKRKRAVSKRRRS